jgi:hypothetical protein
MGPRAGLDVVSKRKIPSPRRESNRDRPTRLVSYLKGKIVPVLNYAPRQEGVLGEWRYSSTHSLTSALDGGE